MEMTKQEKAKNLRWKKAILAEFNLESIRDELSTINYECDDIRWIANGDEGALIAALDGDEEEAFEFRMAFSELSAECEMLYDLLYSNDIDEYFDDMLAGISDGSGMQLVGYDSFEEDYYGLVGYDEKLGIREAKKRIERLTKQQIISAANQTFRALMCFLNIRYKYDYLKASFDVLKGDNTAFLSIIKQIETEYRNVTEYDKFDYETQKKFDSLLAALPDRVWVE